MFDYRSMFDLTGKTALVVGAGRGIGEAGAHGLAAFGAEVFCADVDKKAAENTVEEIRSEGGKGEALELDMTDSGSVRAAGDRVGVLDVLVSTPSINVRKPLLEITDEEFDRVVDLNPPTPGPMSRARSCSWTVAGPPTTDASRRRCRRFDRVHVCADT
jgi:NAD(P)-dependent dehydrogenase (short-subunit alcohol dehydrogenase family)